MTTSIKKVQTVLFTKNFNIATEPEKAQLFLDMNTYAGIIFNGQSVQIPIPNDSPSEFPRIILNNNNGQYVANVALSRTDIFFNIPSDNTQNLSKLLETQKTNSENIFNFLLGKGVIVNRIGFIVTVEKELESEEGSDSREYLLNTFIVGDRFRNPKDLVLGYNRADKTENFDINNLITIKSLSDNKIAIQTDINTSSQIMNTAEFSRDNFNEIMDGVIEKTTELINTFPNI